MDADKHQSLLRVDFNTLGIKVFYKVISMIMKTWRTWWWALSSILKVLKVTSLQCLYNISKKKLWIVQITQNRKFIKFFQYIRKPITSAFVFYCDAKHSDTLLDCSHVCCYLFLGGWRQKWAWPFRSWNSEICCISREWIDKMSRFLRMLIQI